MHQLTTCGLTSEIIFLHDIFSPLIDEGNGVKREREKSILAAATMADSVSVRGVVISEALHVLNKGARRHTYRGVNAGAILIKGGSVSRRGGWQSSARRLNGRTMAGPSIENGDSPGLGAASSLWIPV